MTQHADIAEAVASRRAIGSLVVAGTGIQWAGQTTLAARRAIETADHVLFAVADAGTAGWVRSLRADAVSLRYGNGDGAPRRDVYRRMVDDILVELRRGLRVCAVFYGHPGVFSTPAHEAIRQARSEGFVARMLPGVSFLDCLFADLGLDPGHEGCLAYEATDFLLRQRPFDVHAPLVLSQIAMIGNPHIYDPAATDRIQRGLLTLSEVLCTRYPASHEVIVYDASTHPIEPPRIVRHRLGELASAPVRDVSTLYVPPVGQAPVNGAMRERLSGTLPSEGRALGPDTTPTPMGETPNSAMPTAQPDTRGPSEGPEKTAHMGESLRQGGDYSGAIRCFTQAIEVKPEYAWAYAHRAAARGPLGDYRGALQDFRRAEDHYAKNNKAWFLAHKGELFRLWARATLVGEGQKDAEGCAELTEELEGVTPDWRVLIQRAIDLLSAAVAAHTSTCSDEVKQDPWILCHRGAAYTMRYWLRKDRSHFTELREPGGSGHDAEEDFTRARRDFEAATRSNPSYGWAYAFWSFLMVMHAECAPGAAAPMSEIQEAMQLLGKAQLAGLDRQLPMMRTMMEVVIYAAGRAHTAVEGGTAEPKVAAAAFEEGVQLAWRVLQIDSDETLARYYAANGLKHLEQLGGASAPVADAAHKRARAAVDAMRGRLLAMSGGLDCLEGKLDEARRKLDALRESRDVEALALVSQDPAWRPLWGKSDTKSEDS